MKIITLKHINLLLPEGSSLLHSSENEQFVLNRYFDINFWNDNKLVVGQSKGRNITWFVQSNLTELPWVLRHYYRGGFIAKLINDRYFFSSIKNTRIYKEIVLLEKMLSLGLPVPNPIAGKVQRRGFFYSADLLMEKVEARDLVALLKETKLNDILWKNIGETIAEFHNQSVYHSDLNARNILIDNNDDKVWLIDFDKCELREKDSSWKKDNMKRLKRSFEKEKNINTPFYFSAIEWELLINGYNQNLI